MIEAHRDTILDKQFAMMRRRKSTVAVSEILEMISPIITWNIVWRGEVQWRLQRQQEGELEEDRHSNSSRRKLEAVVLVVSPTLPGTL